MEVSVEIQTRADNGQPVIFRRKKFYSISKERTGVTQSKAEFTVFVKDQNNNDKQINDPIEAQSYVARFVPEAIKEYFFFDGDRLENYFRTATGSKIQKEIMQISQIGTLDQMQKRLKTLSDEYSKDAGRLNPRVEQLRQDRDSEYKNLTTLKQDKERINEQIQSAKVRLEQISTDLSGIPDVAELEKKRLEVINEIKVKSDFIESKKVEKNKTLYKHSIPLLLFEAMRYSKEIIAEKKARGEFPPTTDLDMLDASLKEGSCRICGREIDDSAKNHIQGIKRQLTMSTVVASNLMSIESTLSNRQKLIEKYPETIQSINREIKLYDRDLSELNVQSKTLDLDLKTYGEDKIRGLQEERARLEQAKEDNFKHLVDLDRNITESERKYSIYSKELEQAEVNEEKVRRFIQQHKLCNDAMQIVSDTQGQLLDKYGGTLRNKQELL